MLTNSDIIRWIYYIRYGFTLLVRFGGVHAFRWT